MAVDALAGSFPQLARLYALQLEATPQHQKSLAKRIEVSDAKQLVMADKMAGWVMTLAGDNLPQVLQDYDWICRMVLEEELHFRRSGQYRLSTFQEALENVYSNKEYMGHYMNGLLVSQVWWANHTEAFNYYVDEFLGGFTGPFNHLEIGPGHGLLLYLAGSNPNCQRLEGWDISEESARQTQHALDLLGLNKSATLKVQDMFAADVAPNQFDSVVFSEVLEHLEQPREALAVIRSLLSEKGRLFINVPINSPASDHIFLLRSPEEVLQLVEDCGFEIERSHFVPQTGMTLDRARRMQATITGLVVARRR